MEKRKIINKFTRHLIVEKPRKNGVTTQQITSTLIKAAIDMAFVNESCKSSGQVSKSQVIYRKIEDKSLDEVQVCFRENTLKFFKFLRKFSRNRKFILSFDTTKEAFYGDFSKAEDKLYLHSGSIADGSYEYYEYLTVAITCNTTRYILDGIILPQGAYIADHIYKMMQLIKEQLPIEVVLFDRGFTSWILVDYLQKLKIPYIIFWRKNGNWHKKPFNEMNNGEFTKITRTYKYAKNMTTHKVTSNFILIKKLEYEGKKFDWLFATNLNLKTAENYVKRYKKRWGIETIYRVTDDIRAYTTSTKAIIRYFLFMFTCLVYNIWKSFQNYMGKEFTLANFKTNITILMAKKGLIYPTHYDQFEKTATKIL